MTIEYTANDLALCQSPAGWSLHAPGSSDEDIASGAAPYILCGEGEPSGADRNAAFALLSVPATRESAIDALVALDVAKWGEAEREPSRRMHARQSYGRALNTLAHRAELDYGRSTWSQQFVAAAEKALTPDDWSELRQGG